MPARLNPDCGAESAIALLSGKWKPMLLYHLLQRPLRFNALCRCVPQATRQMLSVHLRELERDGLIRREVRGGRPPQVEYAATALARSLEPLLWRLNDWGERYLQTRASEAASTDLR